MDDIRAIVERAVAEVFEIDITEVSSSEYLFDFAQWDSLTHEQILQIIERQLNVHIPSDKRFDLMTIAEIVDEARALLGTVHAAAGQDNPVH